MPKELWEAAEAVQTESLIEDPWVDILRTALGDWQGKIRSPAIWMLLGVDAERRNQHDNERMGAAMRRLGWKRCENPLRFGTETARGYTKGDESEEVIVERDSEEKYIIFVRLGQTPRVKARRTIIDGRVQPEETNF